MAIPALAADSWPIPGGELGDNQPWTYGHRIVDLIEWEPGTDPNAPYLRAEVPLQKRIDPYQPTQANPYLEYGPQLLWMTGDYGNAFNNGTTHNNVFSQQTLTYWQYIDMFSPWHGAMSANTPRFMWNEMANGSWTRGRMFDFGVINIPNAAYTNAAHKNGALSLACIYFDDNNRAGQPADEIIFQKDENGRYVVADAMIELAQYYGFDGWFFNYEANLHTTTKRSATEAVVELKKAMKQITDAGLHTQMYSTLRTNGTFSGWWSRVDDQVWSFMVDENNPDLDGAISSTFVNYDWSSDGYSVANYTEPYVNGKLAAMGLSAAEQQQWKYDHLFYGVEVSKGEMSSSPNSSGDDTAGHNSVWNFIRHKTSSNQARIYVNPDSTDPAVKSKIRGSVSLFTVDEFTHRRIGDFGKGRLHEMDDYQWIQDERERLYFSGPFSNPSRTGLAPSGYGRPEIGLPEFYAKNTGLPVTATTSTARTIKGWYGVADFITERSVSSGASFYSNFNTGRGLEYRVGGQVSNSDKWSNINIQDILPTWQWWIETEGATGNKLSASYQEDLSVDWDYGPKFVKRDFRTASQSGATHNPGTAYKLDYTSVGAFTGGNSVVLYGDLTANTEWHAFKTDLDVKTNSKASVTFRKSSEDTAEMGLKLYFKDGASVVAPLANTAAAGGWVTSEADLSAWAGNQIAAISFVFTGVAEGYQMNIGNISIADAPSHVAAPANVALEAFYETRELKLTWDKESYDTVRQYNIYADYGTGREFVGGIYGSQFYVKGIKEGIRAIEIRAVGADGVEGPATVVPYSLGDKVRNITVKEAARPTIVNGSNETYGSLIQTADEGKVEASWQAPANPVDFDGYELVVVLNNGDTTEHTASVPASETSAVVEVKDSAGNYFNDGEAYTLCIYTTKDGERLGDPVCRGGYLKDTYCKPYDGVLRFGTGTGRLMRIGNPTSKDWWKIEIAYNGTRITNASSSGNNAIGHRHSLQTAGPGWRGVVNINLGVTLTSKTSGIVAITLTDYSGNTSTVSYDLAVYNGYDTDTQWTATFNYNGATGGIGPASKLMMIGQLYGELPAPTKDYHGFGGWFQDAALTIPVTAGTAFASAANVTLHAAWIPVDRSALSGALGRFGALSPSDWTIPSWAAAQIILSQAQAVYDAPGASQEEVDAAAAALHDAIDNILDPLLFGIGGQPASVVLRKGMKYQLHIETNSPGTVVYISSNVNVTVSDTGLVTAVKTGSAVITVIDVLAQKYFTIVVNVSS